MFRYLKRLYRNEQFYPGFLGLFVNPFYFARKGLFENIVELSSHLSGRLLDVGCGTKPYQSFFNVEEYVGLEIDNSESRKTVTADFFYDGNIMPFDDSSFDSLISNQVFEHVFNPNGFLKEVNRVLKKNGFLLLTVPFVWDEHEQPYDYARYSSFGLKHILSEYGFDVVECKKSNNGLEVIFQLINAYLYKVVSPKNAYCNFGFTLLLVAPINIFGFFISKILPKNDDLYLDNIVLAKKVHDV